MIRKPLPYELTPEDRLTRAKWIRGVGIFYGCAALLLSGFMATQSILAEPNGATGIANAPANPIGARQPAADRNTDAPTASISPNEMRALMADPAISDFVGLAENAFDFSKPDGVPGFGPMRPSDDIDQLHAHATGRAKDPRLDAQARPDVAVGAAQ
jgi:hypothetical protein